MTFWPFFALGVLLGCAVSSLALMWAKDEHAARVVQLVVVTPAALVAVAWLAWRWA